MSESISDAEVKAIRWVEHILAPLIVAAILTLATCMNQTQEAIAQLESNQGVIDGATDEARAEIKVIKRRQEQLLINVQKIDTNQENIKDTITDLKTQNSEILKILREELRDHR